jgi:hypothetical protein
MSLEIVHRWSYSATIVKRKFHTDLQVLLSWWRHLNESMGQTQLPLHICWTAHGVQIENLQTAGSVSEILVIVSRQHFIIHKTTADIFLFLPVTSFCFYSDVNRVIRKRELLANLEFLCHVRTLSCILVNL